MNDADCCAERRFAEWTQLGAVFGFGDRPLWFGGALMVAGPDGTPANLVGKEDVVTGIWGGQPDSVWAVSFAGAIRRWNGADWRVVTQNAGATLRGVWGSATDDVWVVGDQGLALHFDGIAWRRTATDTVVALHAVWGSSADDVWAVGRAGTILHWDALGWTRCASPTQADLVAVHGSGPNAVWAVGDDTVLRLER